MRALIFSCLALVLCSCASKTKVCEGTPVTTFAYSTQRTGAAYRSCLADPSSIESHQLSSIPVLSQVLVIRHSGKTLVSHVSTNGLEFYDEATGTHLETVKLSIPPNGINRSTPVLVERFGKIFGVAFYWREDGAIVQKLYQYDLASKQLKEFDIEIEKVAGGTKKLSKFLFCKTAVAYVEKTNKLVFGCSLVRHGSSWYADEQGIRGALLSVQLTEAGDLPSSTDQVSAFFPSRMSKDPKSGRDSSIWMNGGAPAVLNDGLVAFTTGNGRVDASKNEYGCSALFLDTSDLSVKGYVSPSTLMGSGPRHCEVEDQDLTASGIISLTDRNQNEWFAINGKDGVFRIFDRKQTQSSNLTSYQEIKMTDRIGMTFGQPVGWKDASGTLNWVSLANIHMTSKLLRTALKDDRTLEVRYEATLPYVMARVSPSVGFLNDSTPVLVAVGVSVGPPAGPRILLIDLNSGDLLKEIPFRAVVHFTMPTIFRDRIYLGTVDQGLFVFKTK